MTSTGPVDIVCLGESMVAFRPAEPCGLAEAASFERGIGGAESNVACALARAGHSARWISRVGTDGFGDHLLRTIAATGVDTSPVQRDPHRPTGVYFRTHGDRGADLEVTYYRAGSAASAMSTATVDRAVADSGRVLHLSGITPALSADCRALMRALTAPRENRPLVSLDINYRADLWHGDDQHGRQRQGLDQSQNPAQSHTQGQTQTHTQGRDPELLLDLARTCDVVFVGTDEAASAWGVTGGPRAVRAALPEPPVLVVKQGGEGATAFTAEDTVYAPAPRVSVVAAVGAGDAFAAGFLSGTLRGLPLIARLRHGHLMAAAVLTVPGDVAEPPSRAHADRLVALDTGTWGRLRLGARWITEEATV